MMSEKNIRVYQLKPGRRVAAVVIRDAAIASFAAASVALSVNLFHPEKIPYVAAAKYAILVPCPEPGGEVAAVDPSNSMLMSEDTFVVDARPTSAFSQWRFRNAKNVPFDYLDPTPADTIRELAGAIAESRAKRVLVYGDGDLPDTGEQLGKEISSHGIKNVFYAKGGATALQANFAGEAEQ